MSANVEAPPVPRTFSRMLGAAVAAALVISVLGGAVATRSVDDRKRAVEAPASAPLWDAQKLEAMEGRQLAAELSGEHRAQDPIKPHAVAHVPKRSTSDPDVVGDVSSSGYRIGGPI